MVIVGPCGTAAHHGRYVSIPAPCGATSNWRYRPGAYNAHAAVDLHFFVPAGNDVVHQNQAENVINKGDRIPGLYDRELHGWR
jgi:hypothetical protein